MKKDIKQYIEDIKSDSKKATNEAIEELIPLIKNAASLTNDISEQYEDMFPGVKTTIPVFYYEDQESFEPQDFVGFYEEDQETYFVFNKYRTEYYFPVRMIIDTDAWIKEHKSNIISLVKNKIEQVIESYQADIDTHNQKIEDCKAYINKLKEQLKNI